MTKPEQPKLAVMETAEWFYRDQIASAQPLVRILSQQMRQDPSYFPYSTFVDKESLLATLKHFHDKHGIQYIHIACHGEEGKLQVHGGPIRADSVWNILDKTTLRGVFLSACQLHSLAENIVAHIATGVWIAGYSEDADWLESTAFEMLFWRKTLELRDIVEEHPPSNEEKTAQLLTVLNLLRDDGYGDLMKRLGLCIYIKKGQHVVPLMKDGIQITDGSDS